MTNMDKNLKQVYDATLAMISKLHFKLEALSQEEMYFLLSLLDLVVMVEGEKDVLECLKKWQAGEWSEEINEIIQASLLLMNFNDPVAIKQTQTLISDLLAYQNKSDVD
jgi:hypothetical protein